MDLLLDVIKDAGMDSIRLLPFLFVTYLIMEYIEHKSLKTTSRLMKNAGKCGPLFGGIAGAFPQCGFSAAASSLYAGKVITMGTLIAIYLSTSDEMLPIFISESVSGALILKILLGKVAIGIVTGFIVDIAIKLFKHNEHEHMDIHAVCEQEHCKCEDGIIKSATKHTIKIFLFILLVSIALNLAIELIGEEQLSSVLTSVPALEELLAAVIGLIPNCAASVIITKLYLDGLISAGAMMSGLLVGAGVGLIVLFRLNKNKKANATIIGIMLLSGVAWGVLINLFI